MTEKSENTQSEFGSILADKVANGMGSWKFIIGQTVFVALWMGLNLCSFIFHWDPYPFILLNLVFSTQAAYAAPIIMMSQNRQSAKDRIQAESDLLSDLEDYQLDLQIKKDVENLELRLNKLESEKIDKMIKLLEDIKKNFKK